MLCYEVLGAVMNWLSRTLISQPLSATQLTTVQQTSSKILPSLATLMSRVSPTSVMADIQYPLLEFVYWCVVHVSTNKKQKSSLASTFRRIGETVYKPEVCLMYS